MTTLWQDLRYGFRMLAKNPGFTIVAVLTLALGIGANTAIFTLVNALLLRSLPGVRDPQQLVLVTDNGYTSLHYPLYERLRDGGRSLSALFTCASVEKHKVRVEGSEAAKAEPVWDQAVSGDFFSILGTAAVLGRTLTPDDDRPGDPQAVTVISYDFWQRRFGGDPAAIGKTILLEGVPLAIVGVAPRGFFSFVVGSGPDLWWPIQMVPQVRAQSDGTEALKATNWQWLKIGGRLKQGVTPAQARDELNVIFQRMRLDEADARELLGTKRQEFLTHRIELRPGATGFTPLRSEFQRLLSILMAIVSLVLLVACTNLAGLLLARAAVRGREFSVRAALGAGRWALMRQLVTESLLLAGAGGMLGLLLAQWGVQLLAHYIPEYGETIQLRLTPDLRVLAFTFLISLGTGLLFGLLPAWRTTRLDLVTTLKNETGAVLGHASGLFWNKALVVAQTALTCLLLVGAGLFVRTLVALKTLDAGIHRENLLVFGLDIPADYDRTRQAHLRRDLLRQLEDLPGVSSASSAGVFSLGNRASFFMPNLMTDAVAAKTTRGLHCEGIEVAPDYLKTMGISLLVGRDFGWEDLPAGGTDKSKPARRPVILGESTARGLFGAENPVGRRLWESGRSEPTLEVIGVARDTKHRRLREQASATLFYYLDAEKGLDAAFYVRAQGSALSLAPGVRRIVREVALEVEVTGLRTMESVADEQLYRERALSSLASFFGLLALVLACLGLYGTLSYGVAHRTREIGVRMALGAQRRNVLSVVLRQGMMLTFIGCGLGVLLAIALTRVISSLLYGVTPTDPLTFALTVLLLSIVAFVSCWLPARRAARIDPMAALRCE